MRILCASFACGKGSRALETWWFGASGFEPTTERDARQEEDERSKCKKCVRWHSTIRWTSTNHRLVHVDRERIAFAWRDPSSFRKSDWSWQTKGNVETAGPGRATCTTASSTIHRARRCVSRPYGATRRWSTWRCVGCAVARRGGLETEFVWRVLQRPPRGAFQAPSFRFSIPTSHGLHLYAGQAGHVDGAKHVVRVFVDFDEIDVDGGFVGHVIHPSFSFFFLQFQADSTHGSALDAFHQVRCESCDFVPHPFGGDDGHFVGDPFVDVEVEGEFGVVLFHDHPGGSFDGFGSHASLDVIDARVDSSRRQLSFSFVFVFVFLGSDPVVHATLPLFVRLPSSSQACIVRFFVPPAHHAVAVVVVRLLLLRWFLRAFGCFVSTTIHAKPRRGSLVSGGGAPPHHAGCRAREKGRGLGTHPSIQEPMDSSQPIPLSTPLRSIDRGGVG